LPPLVFRDGLTLLHGPHDDPIALFREMFIAQPYTSGGFYRPQTGDTLIDLGANIGGFMLFIQHQARGARVHCFEPAADAFARLAEVVSANQLEDYVQIYRLAIEDHEGTVALKDAECSTHRSVFANSFVEDNSEEWVRCVTLDEAIRICGADTVDLLKIDVEGAEVEIVEGAGAAIWERIKRVAVECHDLFRPNCRARVVRLLESRGYRIVDDQSLDASGGLETVRAER
jgi:FkbM family methyltransferase